MEKYDDTDILDDTKDDLLVIRSYNHFPGYFTKMLKSGDDVLTFSQMYTTFPAFLGTDHPCYRLVTTTGTELGHLVSLSSIINNNDKFTSYAKNFSQYRVMGCKISGWSVSTDSPFSGVYTERISYPPLLVNLVQLWAPGDAFQSLSAMINSDTCFKVLSDGSEHSKSYVLPNQNRYCAEWLSTTSQVSTYYAVYIGGYLFYPLADPSAVSECFHLQIDVYVKFKDYQPISTDY